MFLQTQSIVILGIGSLLALFYILLLLAGGKYADMVRPLTDKEFPLKDVYVAGFAAMDLFRYSFQSKGELKRGKYVELLYGKKYCDYYLRVIAAQRFSLSYLLLLLGFIFYGMQNDISLLALSAMFAGTAWYYFGSIPETKIKKKTEELLSEFPNVVSKLALLINAGMIMREAWEKVAKGGDGKIYEEMRLTLEEMENGVSEQDAYYHFGVRCVIPEIKKFTATVMQGLVKGNKEFALMIREQSREVWDIKQHHVRQQGEKAASKLMIPITIMFLGVIIIIIVPIFANLGV